MKHFLLLIFCAVAATAAVIPEDEHVNGVNGWYVPRVDGTFDWIDKDEAESYLETMVKMEGCLSTNPVDFYLYTESNPSKGQKISASKESIDASHFNAENPTRITIHGWNSSKDSYVNSGIREAWLTHGDYNMITVDWGCARSFYADSFLAAPVAGRKIAAFVDFLEKNCSLNLDTLEIIGHSLGAHVAGFTGKNIQGGQARTIVGLDPALPLFSYEEPDKRLCSTDAIYVESIQTNGGGAGFLKPIGKGAFYPNGGRFQPGCDAYLIGPCSHRRSVFYYIESIMYNNFATVQCDNYKSAVAKDCGSKYSSVRMGAVTNACMVAGDYYVPVNSKAPFGVMDLIF